MRKKIFLVISEEDTICPECGSTLCRRDKKLRIHNELPDCMFPYKHYGTEIIEDVVDEVVGSDDLGTEDYPCEGTMKHWKWWISRNEANINGQMRSMLHHLLDLDIEFLKSRESLLKELRERISPGWLSVVTSVLSR